MIGTGVVQLAGFLGNIHDTRLTTSTNTFASSLRHKKMADVLCSEIKDPAPTKSGRHSRFTPQQDLAIVREVAAVRAHLAEYGETKKRFATVAERAGENAHFRGMESIGWKTAQDRYKRLQINMIKVILKTKDCLEWEEER